VAALEQDDRHVNSTQDHSNNDGPKENDDFAALFPRWLPVINQSAQQVNQGMFWFDTPNMGPIPQMSMDKWIYLNQAANSPRLRRRAARSKAWDSSRFRS
jgi:hypothetical protein